jgi:hypothetical protein
MEAQYDIKGQEFSEEHREYVCKRLDGDNRFECILRSERKDTAYHVADSGVVVMVYSEAARFPCDKDIFAHIGIIGKEESFGSTKAMLEQILGFQLDLKMKLNNGVALK